LAEDSAFTVSIELSLIPGTNAGDLATVYDLTVTSGGTTAGGTFNGTSQNLNEMSLNNFQFVASTTTSVIGTIEDFTVSDMPISIPESSSILLSLIGVSALIWRRRKN